MPRIIVGLREAALTAHNPWPKRRARGSRSKGLAYERKVQRALRRSFPRAFCGQWIVFEDANGRGYAQPDAYALRHADILLLEAKLSYRESAWEQMRRLYVPLLEFIYARPVTCVLVTKYSPATPEPRIHDLASAVDGSVWHWLGQ